VNHLPFKDIYETKAISQFDNLHAIYAFTFKLSSILPNSRQNKLKLYSNGKIELGLSISYRYKIVEIKSLISISNAKKCHGGVRMVVKTHRRSGNGAATEVGVSERATSERLP
jgi:hypothetical protein